MYRIQQPTNTTCGQTCVAMIVDRTVDEVCEVMRTRGKTTVKHLIKALNHFGVVCGSKLQRYSTKSVITPLAVLRVRHPHQNLSHWVVRKNGNDYDPDSEVCVLAYGWRLTSFLTVSL